MGLHQGVEIAGCRADFRGAAAGGPDRRSSGGGPTPGERIVISLTNLIDIKAADLRIPAY